MVLSGDDSNCFLLAPELDVDELRKVEKRLGSLSQECPHIPEYVNKRMQKEPPRGISFDAPESLMQKH